MREPNFLQTVWFALIGVLWVGYFVLEGFDFGVGMLLRVLGRDETEKRMIIHSIGPVWDGNEVWLITAGGATFAAFPGWYASLFSGFYIALFLILVALIIRGVSFEFWGKEDSPRWRATWEWTAVVGSFLTALLWGVGWADIVHGVPMNAQHNVTASLWDLLHPYALLGGLTTLALFLSHGAIFLSLRTRGTMVERARAVAKRASGIAALSMAGFLLWTTIDQDGGGVKVSALVLAIAAVALAGVVPLMLAGERDGRAFALSAGAIALMFVSLFVTLFPEALPSSTSHAYDLSLVSSSATHYTQTVMTVVAVVFVPIVLAYQAWTYWVFRHRLGRDDFEGTPTPLAVLESLGKGRGNGKVPEATAAASFPRPRSQLDALSMAAPVDRRLIAQSGSARAHLLVAALIGVCSAALIVAQAALLAFVIERAAMAHATLVSLQPELIALATVLCARALAAGAFELSGRWGAVRVMSELRGRLARRLLLESPERRPGAGRTGELAGTAVQGVDALQDYFAGYLPQLVLACAVPLAVIAWVLTLDPVAAGILIVTVPILVTFMVLIGKGARTQAEGRWRALSLLGAHFLDVVQGLATLRAYGRERAQEATLAEVGERYRSETMATLRVAFLSALVLELCAMIGTALVAATIGVQLVEGDLGLRAGLMVLLLAPELYGPLRQVGQQFHSSADAGSAYERILAALEGPAAIANVKGSRPAPSPALSPVRFEGVSYEYPGREAAALDRIDLELEPGLMHALIGPSGAGKSTLASLLMRLADPSAGRITCAGIDLRELDLDGWRAQIAWVPQRPTLFTGTVAQNIALYRPDAGEREIERAVEAAGAQVLIAGLPDGLGTQVGEGTRRLSAGQAQRVALARAFLADRPLLVLDEPAAHLDEDSAQSVGQAIERLARGRTTLLISHQPTLSALADELHVIGAGRLDHHAESLVAA